LAAAIWLPLTNSDIGGLSMSGYFSALQKALQDAGFFRPMLVLDRQRVKANTDLMLSHLQQDFAYRTVAKSLPAEELISQVMEHTGSRKIMAFHQPFLKQALALWPDAELLLGKPMPVAAVKDFFDTVDNPLQAAHQVQWLVDSVQRINQYREFAQLSGLNLRIVLELDVGLGIAERLGVVVLMAPRHLQLRRRHINTHHLAMLPNQRRQRIDIAARTAAEVEDARAFQRLRRNQPAAVIAGQHLVMDLGQHRLHMVRYIVRRAAGIGLEVAAALQHLAVISLHVFMFHGGAFPDGSGPSG